MELHRITSDGHRIYKTYYQSAIIETPHGNVPILIACFEQYEALLNDEELKAKDFETWKRLLEYYKRDYKERVCEYHNTVRFYTL